MEKYDGPNLRPNIPQSNGENNLGADVLKPQRKSSAIYIIIGIVILFFVSIVAFAGYAVYQTIEKNAFSADPVFITSTTSTTSQLSNIESAQIGSKDNEIYSTAHFLQTALETYYTINAFYPPDNHIEYLWSGNRIVMDLAPILPAECGEINEPSDECGVVYTTTDEGEGYLIDVTYLAQPDEVIKGGMQRDDNSYSDTKETNDEMEVTEQKPTCESKSKSLTATPSLSPMTFNNLVGNPGQIISLTQTITNNDKIAIVVSILPENLIVDNDGIPETTNAETPYSLKDWVLMSEQEITIEAGDSQKLNFTIKVPDGAELGKYMGALTFDARSEAQKNNECASTAGVSTFLVMQVEG